MAKLIFISPYLKGGKNAAHLANRTRYFATREGVQLLKDDNSHLPVTQKQEQYIQRLLRSFSEAKELTEYEDYRQTPNRQTAFDLIEQIHEDFIEPMDSRENYLDYISNRPGVKALGEHGLWNGHGKVESLENAVQEVAQHDGNVWTPIISLTRENAERLGYTDVENWQGLIAANLSAIAKGYKIKPDNLRWYAALHEKEKHIHVHMIIFSTDPKEGYLTKQGIRDIKSALVRTAYRNERMHLYEQKSNQRELLQKEAERHMAQLIEQMENGMIHNTKLERLTQELAERLKECSGKKVYGYLPPRVKRIVDEIVDELAKDERVAEAYDLWQTLREQLCRDYSETVPERVSLSQQRDFKTVRNMVIRETLKLSEYRLEFANRENDEQPISEEPESKQPVMTEKESTAEQAKNSAEHKNNIDSNGVGETVLRMLHQMSRIFRENSAQPAIYASMKMDKKRRRELQQKRLALGHKADDHDDSGLTQHIS